MNWLLRNTWGALVYLLGYLPWLLPWRRIVRAGAVAAVLVLWSLVTGFAFYGWIYL